MQYRTGVTHRPDVGAGAAPHGVERGLGPAGRARPCIAVPVQDRAVRADGPDVVARAAPDADERSRDPAGDGRPRTAVPVQDRVVCGAGCVVPPDGPDVGAGATPDTV